MKNKLFTAFNETKTLKEWARDSKCVVTLPTLNERVRKRDDWGFEKILTTPLNNTKYHLAFGESKTLEEWSKDPRFKIEYGTLVSRVGRRNWSIEKALTTPLLTEKAVNCIGKIYYGIKVLNITGTNDRQDIMVRVLCACGDQYTTKLANVKSGKSTSCKVCRKKKTSAHFKKHGLGRTMLGTMWYGMHSRCYNPNMPNYQNYGERNITIDKNWIMQKFGGLKNNQGIFNYVEYARKVALDQGLSWEEIVNKKSPNGKKWYTYDRIDNDKPYEPGNMRWATPSQQCNNQRKRIRNSEHNRVVKELNEKILKQQIEINELSLKLNKDNI